MSDETLKKPVHVVLVKPSLIQSLVNRGRLKDSMGDEPAKLPVKKREPKYPKMQMPKMVSGKEVHKKQQTRVKLRVIHDSIKSPSGDLTPPCGECKTAACCHAFVVSITKEEYESGLYGDDAVLITEEMQEQLNSLTIWASASSLLMTNLGPDANKYVLEGLIGEPCPFLKEGTSCGIYGIRPVTCRVYTCVGDHRITQGMRDGTEPIRTMFEKAIEMINARYSNE